MIEYVSINEQKKETRTKQELAYQERIKNFKKGE